MELENILRTAFPSLSEQSLAMIAKQCRLVKHPRNGILFLEGDTGTGFYALSSGTVKIYKTSPAGQETVLRLQGPGSIFAEVILFESDVYPVSAAAMTPVSAVLIPREHFLGLLDEPRFRNEFIATLMHKQRYLTDRAPLSTAPSSSWMRPLLARIWPRVERNGVPSMAVTLPPASRTSTAPAEMSQGFSLNSQ